MAASDNRRPSGGHTLFRYTAKDIDGRTVRGTMEATDYDALYAQLLEQGLYPQRVTGRGADRRPRTLRPQELSDLCRQLSTLLASGVSLVRALTIISQDEGISAGLRRVYESVLSEVRKGSSLSDALEAQQVFPALMLGMIRAGEGSGRLDRVAERLAVHYEKAHQMNQQVKSALMYPMILAVLSVAVVIVIVTFVLPQFSDLFSTMDSLPAVTLALMAFSDFMVTKWYLLLLGLAALAAALRALLRVPSVRLALDRGKLTMPVFGKLHRIICTARFARTISSLYASGLPIITALQTGCGFARKRNAQGAEGGLDRDLRPFRRHRKQPYHSDGHGAETADRDHRRRRPLVRPEKCHARPVCGQGHDARPVRHGLYCGRAGGLPGFGTLDAGKE